MNVRAVCLIVCGEEILITADAEDYILPDKSSTVEEAGEEIQ